MNIHELSIRTGIALRDLRTLEKLNVLHVDPENDVASRMRFGIARNPILTLPQFLELVADPEIFDQLEKYEKRVRAQFDALGDFTGEAAPKAISAYISDAAKGDDKATAAIAGWLREALQAAGKPAEFLWIAARLVMGVPDRLRDAAAAKVNLALSHTRKREDLAGWWRVETVKGRKKTIYAVPKKALANLDL